MNFLIDAQLPPRLSSWLNSKGHESKHINELENGLTLPDIDVWKNAKENEAIIVTKDSDFFELSHLQGSPPQILHIAVGNMSNTELLSVIDKNLESIERALKEGARIVSVSPNHIRVFE